MKKTVLFLGLLFVVFTSNAQRFGIGLKGGLNLANQTHVNNSKNLTGFNGGLVLNCGGKMFSFQPEILYTQKGYKSETTVPFFGTFNGKFRANYLEVPALLKFAIGMKSFKFFINAGPYAAYWLGGYSELNGNKTDHNFDTDYGANNRKDNRWDFGVAAGAGFLFFTGDRGSFFVEGRYTRGLSDIYKYNGSRPAGVDKISNKVINLNLGYIFYIGGDCN